MKTLWVMDSEFIKANKFYVNYFDSSIILQGEVYEPVPEVFPNMIYVLKVQCVNPSNIQENSFF